MVVTYLTLSDADLRLHFLRHICHTVPALEPYLTRYVKGKATHDENKQKQDAKKMKKEAVRQSELQKRRENNLSQENATLKAEAELLRREVSKLRRELQQYSAAGLQKTGRQTSTNAPQTDSNGMINKSNTPAPPTLRGKKLYAYGATSFSPYGFNKDDLSETFTEQLFIITFTDNTHADLTVADSLQQKKILLRDLNYYGQLVEIVKRPMSEASGFNVLKKGRLTLRTGVWTIDQSIKIEIT